MTQWLVELSGENLPLARAELAGATEALHGRLLGVIEGSARLEAVAIEGRSGGQDLADRLALSRRVLRRWPAADEGSALADLARGARPGETASFRTVGRMTTSPAEELVTDWVRAWKSGGGEIDLEHPDRRFLFVERTGRAILVGEEIARVDRRAIERRRMPNLPFQRPVSLRPRLARVAANLAVIRPGDLVVDPFVGTGALLAEAALLGARVVGIDRDARMVAGSIRNLSHLGAPAERFLAMDAAQAAGRFAEGAVQAILTDPPYGRASGSAGEDPAGLVRRVLSAWADRIAAGGRIALVTPGGPDPLGPPWARCVSVPDRVHRSLTREFRVYRRDFESASPGPIS